VISSQNIRNSFLNAHGASFVSSYFYVVLLTYQEMSVADIENLQHVSVPHLSEHFFIFLGYFIILILKIHRFCAVVVRMAGSVARFCRLLGGRGGLSHYGKNIDLIHSIIQCWKGYLGF
jgi:hypothetical protein